MWYSGRSPVPPRPQLTPEPGIALVLYTNGTIKKKSLRSWRHDVMLKLNPAVTEQVQWICCELGLLVQSHQLSRPASFCYRLSRVF